ncbi:MAG TPA: hypothetical protein VIX80_07650 [Candidatus Kapabacteria bacterium]
MAQNYESQGGKYYQLYVTSPNKTTVNVAITGGTTYRFPINAYEVSSFFIPLGWEVTTSGVVEDKAIRVWSNDADITAYLLSRNPATSDGMYIIPTIGWGTEYVVAAYGSLFEGFGNFTYDYPSEFCLVANQDNTVIQITPTTDIRTEGEPTTVLHKKGVMFTEVLNRGQVVQYQAVLAEDLDHFDFTGTYIKSNKPIGVVGASQCPNVPGDYTYCDHICDMIPPIRTWAQNYATVPFANRRGGDTFLIIASKDGQTIYRNGAVFCVLSKKYEPFFRPDVSDASSFTSDAPFLVAQYINSTTWQDDQGNDNAGIGDPAMVVVNSIEQFTPEVVFQTPTISTGTGFSNYANVIVHDNAITNTTFDGQPIAQYKATNRMKIPFSAYTAFRVRSLNQGTHYVKSDSGVGVYVYGYGSYDSYAWSGALGIRTFNDPDTIPPLVSITGDCYCAEVGTSDNHLIPQATRLSDMVVDSNINMYYTPDPSFNPGVADDSSFYSMCVIDPSKEAKLVVTMLDFSGNRTTVTSVYKPMFADIQPQLVNYGTGTTGQPISQYVTITNTGQIPYTIEDLKLFFGNKGFKIDSAITTDIPVGGSRQVKISFEPKTLTTVTDTLILDDGCSIQKVVLVGNGGAPDFVVSGYDFKCNLVGQKVFKTELLVTNTSSTQPLTIQNITVDDVAHFGFDPLNPASNTLPYVIPPAKNGFNGQKKFEVSFIADKIGNFQTLVHVTTLEAGDKTGVLYGCGIAPAGVTIKDVVTSMECDQQVPFVFRVIDTGSAPLTIDKVIVTGDPNFTTPTYTNSGGQTVTLPITLQPGEEFNAFITFNPPANAAGLYTANIFAISNTNDTTNSASATVNAIYRDMVVTKDSAGFATVPFGSSKQSGTLEVCNNAKDTLTIFNVTEAPGTYQDAFAIIGYRVGTTTYTAFPIKLAENECLIMDVEFDPAFRPDPVQNQHFIVSGNACGMPLAVLASQGGTSLGGPTIQGGSAPLTFSCATNNLNVTVTNPNPLGSVSIPIKSVAVNGVDMANFVATMPAQPLIAPGSNVVVPVTFLPTASVGARSYTATAEVTVTLPSGLDSVMTAMVMGSSDGMVTNVSSLFAIADQQVLAGDNNIVLPIDFSVTKDPNIGNLDQADIRRITLTYQYNTDILDIPNNNVVAAVRNLQGGWSVDPASNVVNGIGGAPGTLTLILTSNTPLADGATNLGEIFFDAKLAKEKATTVMMTSVQLAQNATTPVGACVTVQGNNTATELVYQCGDTTMVRMMNGEVPTIISPASPNPVTSQTGGVVTFRYATRFQGNVKLELVDELGNVAAVVVDRHMHPAGAYEVRYDTSKLPSGAYIYRLALERAVTSGKLIVNH